MTRAVNRTVRALAVALLVPTVSGVVAALVGDRVLLAHAEAGDDTLAIETLTLLLGLNAAIALGAHAIAAACAWLLAQHAAIKQSTLAQPLVIFGALRPLGALLLVASVFVAQLREPLIGIAAAILDAAFVLVLMLAVAPLLAARAWQARLAGGAYAVVRVVAAIGVVSAPELASASLAHRLLGVWAAGAVALVLGALAKRLDAHG